MAVINLPTDFLFGAASFGIRFYHATETSENTGTSEARFAGPPRIACVLESTDGMDLIEAGQWASLFLRLRGNINYLAVYDPVRTEPRGTLRGSPLLSSSIEVGDTSMVLKNANGGLRAGDWLQLGAGVGSSQMVMVVEDCEPISTNLTVVFEPPARYDYAVDTVATWDHPRVYMKVENNTLDWTYPQYLAQEGFRAECLEQWGVL